MRARLGINNCFAVKRWPRPDDWAAIVADDLGLDLVELSLDQLAGPDTRAGRDRMAEQTRAALSRHGLRAETTFTGLAAYSLNLLMHPEAEYRAAARRWYKQAIELTADLGATATGGHVGSLSVPDWSDPATRARRWADLRDTLAELAAYAHQAGLHHLLVENLVTDREPSTMALIENIVTERSVAHAPIQLCLDLGHPFVCGGSPADRDPYAWIERRRGRRPADPRGDPAVRRRRPAGDQRSAGLGAGLDPGPGRTGPAMTAGLVHAEEADLYYQVDGAGPQTLVLVNGVGDPLEGWANQLDAFLAAGLRVVSFDNRGVGRSSQPPGPYTSAEMAADLHAVVTAAGLDGFHLAGVSMGGVIAQEYALAHPANLRSLVLANTFAAADPFTRAAFESWAQVAQAAGMPMMMRAQAPWIFSPDFYAQYPERVAELIAEAQQSPQPAAAFAAQTAALVDHDARDRLATLRAPTLVIAAADDIIIRPALSRRLFEALPDAAWSVVPGGHAAFWEDPGPWNQAVIQFVHAHR